MQWLKALHPAARHLPLIDLSFTSLTGVTDGERWKESSGSLNKGAVSNSRRERFGRRRLRCLVISGTPLQADERLANVIAQLKMCHSFPHPSSLLSVIIYILFFFDGTVKILGSQQSVRVTWRCQESATRHLLGVFPGPFGALMMENVPSPLLHRRPRSFLG